MTAPRAKSNVWAFYETNNTDDATDGQSAVCKECKLVVKRKNNTTNLIHHLKKHPRLYEEYTRLNNEKNKTVTEEPSTVNDDNNDNTPALVNPSLSRRK